VYMDPLISNGGSVNMLGFIGAGKSHLLLAYAVYMMGRRALEIPAANHLPF
jgi:DNA replication protein DnaC